MRRVAALCALALAFVACGSDEPRAPGEVGMTESHAFDPKEITIDAGETVTWINDSSESHTVTAYEDSLPEGADYFDNGGAEGEEAARDDVGENLMQPGDTFEVSFDQPGTYRYLCIPHEGHGMTGTVVVR